MKNVSPTLVPELLASLPRPFRSRRAIERYQAAALRRLVRHAFDRVPLYRRLYQESGVRPEDVRGLEDLSRLPTTSRRQMQETPIEERIETGVDLSRCASYETSGSTGEPLRIVRTQHEDARLFGRRLRAQILAGLRPWDLRVNIGSPRKIFGWHRLGAFRIRTVQNRQPHEGLVDKVAAADPDVLIVSPESLALLLEQMEEGGRRPAPRRIFTGANQLPPGVRRRATEAFGAPITDFYATTECNLIAWQCDRCGVYHTSDDSVIVELVGDDGLPAAPGEEGEVVLTTLHTYSMPFLRFRLGDLATRPREPRRCAIRFGAIERIEGRVADYIRSPSGVRIGPFRIMDAIDELPGVQRWQMVQVTPDRVEVRFEALAGTDVDAVASAIARRCAELFPGDLTIEPRATRFTDEGAGGAKLRFVRALS
jgi:phenylacetate-CoA ligase